MTGLICSVTWEFFHAELVNGIQVKANMSSCFILFRGCHARIEAKVLLNFALLESEISAFHEYGQNKRLVIASRQVILLALLKAFITRINT